ncbi:hypothetical protein IWQ56_005511, partial [Coemansia nantahalensis]
LLQSSVKHTLPPSETTQAVVRALGTNASAFVCRQAVVKAASFVGALPLSDSTPAVVRAASIGLINYACGRAVDKLSSHEPLRGTTLGVVRRAADAAAYAAAYAQAGHELVATAHAFGKDTDNVLLSGSY